MQLNDHPTQHLEPAIQKGMAAQVTQSTGSEMGKPHPGAEQISEEEKNRVKAELALREYDLLRGQERDLMNNRFQIWAGAITLVSLLSLVAAPGIPGYAIAIGPFLLAFMGRYAGGCESSLRVIRSYLRVFEKRYGYMGYEHYYDSLVITRHGGGRLGLRDTLLLNEAAITIILAVRVWADHWPVVAMIIAMIVAVSIGAGAARATWIWLGEPAKPIKKQTDQLKQRDGKGERSDGTR